LWICGCSLGLLSDANLAKQGVVWDLFPCYQEVQVVTNLGCICHRRGQWPWAPAAEPALGLGRVRQFAVVGGTRSWSPLSYISAHRRAAQRVFISLVLVQGVLQYCASQIRFERRWSKNLSE